MTVRWLPRVIASCLLLRALAGAEQVSVAFTQLGSKSREVLTAEVERFVTKLDAHDELQARQVSAGAGETWTSSAADRLQLVAVTFGTHRDWLALAYADDGAVRLCRRRPSTTSVREGYLHTMEPGPDQVAHNAVAELAADVADFMARPPAAVRRPTVSIKVSVEPVTGMGSPQTIGDTEQAGLQALALAAAADIGWQPQLAGGELQITVQVTPEVEAYTIELASAPDGKRVSHRGVPVTALYEGLRNLLRDLRFWQGAVADYMQLTPPGLTLLGSDGRRLFSYHDGVLTATAIGTGLQLWRIPKPERQTPLYAGRNDVDGKFSLYRYQPRFDRIDLDTGAVIVAGGNAAASAPWSFATAVVESETEPFYAAANNRTLTVAVGMETRWQYAAGGFLGGGPRFAGERVFVGGDTGELAAFALTGETPVWRARVASRLRGPLGSAFGAVIASSVSGPVHAFEATTGTLRWQFDLGDLAAAEPQEVGEALLVAGVQGQVYLLDPQSGRTIASRSVGRQLTGIAVARNLIVCADRFGAITMLDAGSLEPRKTFTLQARLQPGLFFLPDLPHQWRTAEQEFSDLTDSGPAVIVADRRGFVYAIPLPREDAP